VFQAVRADIERFFILYELETPEVLDGPAYLARLNAPTSWSQRIMPKLANFVRGGGVVTARGGAGGKDPSLLHCVSNVCRKPPGAWPTRLPGSTG